MSEIKEEIDRLIKEGDLMEGIKNTIVSMLNTSPVHHDDMAEFCLQALNKYQSINESKANADQLALLDKVRESMLPYFGTYTSGVDYMDEVLNKIKQELTK